MKRGKKYVEAAKAVDRATLYDTNEAISLVKKAAVAKFDETIEVHIRTGCDGRHADQQIRGAVVLPHGTGKKVRVLVFAKDAKAEEAKAAKAAAKKSSKSSSKSSSSSSSEKSYSAPSGSNGQAVVNYASQFVGNPYVYGGSSLTNGTDCSGFTRGVYKKFGKRLPHSSSAQRRYGKKVKGGIKNAQEGDLICYSGHVAIYCGGNTIVHASNPSDGIKYTSPANYKSIIAVRRIF